MFIGLISAWFACLTLYSGSERQQLWSKRLPTLYSYSLSIVFFTFSIALTNTNFPTTSAVIACSIAVFTFLPLQTIVSAYHKRYTLWLTAVVTLMCVLLTLMEVQ